ncbi:MAG: hypothetical protein O2954_20985, partial [bacterium]|nr:hypothetical protein [bacterium]
NADLDPTLVTLAENALRAFRNSDLWSELQTAEAVYTEVPFSASDEHEGLSRVTRGTIDLAYRLPHGWKIVDYKSDAVSTDKDLQTLLTHATRQINTYAKHWQTLTGEQVVEKGVWSTEKSTFLKI